MVMPHVVIEWASHAQISGGNTYGSSVHAATSRCGLIVPNRTAFSDAKWTVMEYTVSPSVSFP
jgi:hypothetical protein